MLYKKNMFAAILAISSLDAQADNHTLWGTNYIAEQLSWLYVKFFDDTEYYWSLEGGGGIKEPDDPNAYEKYYLETPSFIESGAYKSEPYNHNVRLKWSEAHLRFCLESDAYREMPITTKSEHYESYETWEGTKKSIKSFIVNQNVPNPFQAKVHGGLSDYVSDSFYFWSFGDGMRRYNTKGDDYKTVHAYPFLGNYILSSIVYAENWSIYIGIGGDLSGDFSLSNTDVIWPKLETHDTLYIEGCDVAKVKVIPNNSPVASISRTSLKTFSAINSFDPDGNPITYSWSVTGGIGGMTSTGSSIWFDPKPYKDITYAITLSVTDGDMYDSTTMSVLIPKFTGNRKRK